MLLLAMGCLLGVAVFAGAKPDSMESDMLDSPGGFTQKFGSRLRFHWLRTFRKETWKHQTIEDWSFASVTFKETTMDSNVFERVTFRDCTFDESKMNHSRFRDCRFVGCTFKGQRWIGNTFEGGEFRNCTWKPNPISSDLPEWELNTFDSLVMDGISIQKGASYWDFNVFRKVKFSDFDFTQHGMIGDEFESCEFGQGDWVKTVNTVVTQLKFRDCIFHRNPGQGSVFGGDFTNVRFEGGTDLDAWGTMRQVWIAPGGAIALQRVESSRIAGSHPYVSFDSAIDVEVDDVSKGGKLGTVDKGVRNLSIHKADVQRAVLHSPLYENCLFENWEVQELWIGKDATFRNCTFRNIHITKEVVVSGPVHFEGCTFHNMRRDPGVKSFLNEDPSDYLFPFEQSPGVNKR